MRKVVMCDKCIFYSCNMPKVFDCHGDFCCLAQQRSNDPLVPIFDDSVPNLDYFYDGDNCVFCTPNLTSMRRNMPCVYKKFKEVIDSLSS